MLMIEAIQQIRLLLEQLETSAVQADKASEFRAYSGLELPDIMCDVVDLLMPECAGRRIRHRRPVQIAT
jgi:hypothetical protein